jgi:hypothetical protein
MSNLPLFTKAQIKNNLFAVLCIHLRLSAQYPRASAVNSEFYPLAAAPIVTIFAKMTIRIARNPATAGVLPECPRFWCVELSVLQATPSKLGATGTIARKSVERAGFSGKNAAKSRDIFLTCTESRPIFPLVLHLASFRGKMRGWTLPADLPRPTKDVGTEQMCGVGPRVAITLKRSVMTRARIATTVRFGLEAKDGLPVAP